MKLLSLATLSLALAAPAGATELLFAGQVQQLTLQPSGVGDCPPMCPADTGPDKNGVSHVCVSNAGGCQTATVKVVTDYLATSETPLLSFKSRTGEWGKLNFPVKEELILVHAVDGVATWAPLLMRDGKAYFKAADMREINRVPVHALAKDGDGLVPLDQLVAAIHAAH
ncbi:hypothetical protein ACL9RI_17030 [Janthinobacterium sp. Mn2066]|uniref:hypothetical protein n=1 Tax=Janthinobacterium sp. Mn2066 TaxID=3395264 RepID=UPI003BE10EE9